MNNYIMLAGAILWLIGELWGVIDTKKNMDTTSEFVWWLQVKIPLVRWLVFVFCVSLIGHFMYHLPLLP